MSDQYLGEIRMVGFNFAPVGWALCNGQLLNLSQYQALFALLGTYYGGNGTSTFALPDLRGRFALCEGTSPGQSPYVIGQSGGQSSTTLTANNLAVHNHIVSPFVSTAAATATNPVGNVAAVPAATVSGGTGRETVTVSTYASASGATQTAASFPTNPAGGGQPFASMPPYLAINFIIALVGIFPSRN